MDAVLSPEMILERARLAARVRVVSRERQALEELRVLSAYRQLLQDVNFNLVLDYWIDRILLRQHTTPEATGQHNFLVQILEDLARAQTVSLQGGPS